jgi:gamma-glutamyl hydrolase
MVDLVVVLLRVKKQDRCQSTRTPKRQSDWHLPPNAEAFASTPELHKRWKVTSVNLDLNGKPFVSTLEPIDPISFPVYGVQYHPEKNAFEYGLDFHDGNNVPYEAIDHSPAGLTMSIHMATYFVNVVRGNMLLEWENQQQDDNIQTATTFKKTFPLVYTYPRRVGTKFEEIYIVPPAAVSLSNDMGDSAAAAAAATLLPSLSLRRREGGQTNR